MLTAILTGHSDESAQDAAAQAMAQAASFLQDDGELRISLLDSSGRSERGFTAKLQVVCVPPQVEGGGDAMHHPEDEHEESIHSRRARPGSAPAYRSDAEVWSGSLIAGAAPEFAHAAVRPAPDLPPAPPGTPALHDVLGRSRRPELHAPVSGLEAA